MPGVFSGRGRWLLAVLLGAVTTDSGCDCGGADRAAGVGVSLAFVFPTDGAVVNSSDDVNPDVPGIQVNVQLDTPAAANGTVVTLSNNLAVDAGGVPIPVDATVSGGRVIFGGYTLPSGIVTLTAELGAVQVTATVTAVENLCVFNTPRNGDRLPLSTAPENPAYVNLDDPFDPFELDVILDCDGVAPGEHVALRVLCTDPACVDSEPSVVQADASGRVVFERVALAEGSNRLVAVARTDASGNNAQGSTSEITVVVDTGRCTARLFPGDRSVLLAGQDTRTDTPGMQATVDLISDCAVTATGGLVLGGAPCGGPGSGAACLYAAVAAESLPSGETRFRFTEVSLPESTTPYDVELVGTVEGGASGESGFTLRSRYWVDSIRPLLASALPPADACYVPSQDTDAVAAGLQIAVTGTVTGAEDGAEVWLRAFVPPDVAAACVDDTPCVAGELCRGGLCRTVALLSGGAFGVAALSVPAGAVSLEYVATDIAGNIASPVLVPVLVVPTEPQVSVVQPASGANLNILQHDADPVTPGMQVRVELGVSDAEVGSSATLLISGEAPVLVPLPQGVAQSVTVDVSVADGAHVLSVRVPDACGNNVIPPAVPFTIYSDIVNLVVLAYESQGSGFVERRDVADGATTSAAAVDLDVFTGTSEVGDRAVAVEVRDGVLVDANGRTCIGTVLASANAVVPQANEGLLVPGVALAPGTNCVSVISDDGVLALTSTLVLTRRTAAPQVRFTDPDALQPQPVVYAAGDDSSATIPGFNRSVAVTFDAPDTARGRLTVEIGAQASVSTYTPAGTAAYTFADLGLPQSAAAYNLHVYYEDTYGLTSVDLPGSNVQVSVDVDPAAEPQLLVTAPSAGAELRNAAFDVTVVHLGGDTPAICDLLVVADPASTTPEVAAEPWPGVGITELTFANAAMPSAPFADGPWWVVVRCDNAGGDTGVSNAVPVLIDETPPDVPQLMERDDGATFALDFATPGAFVNTLVADTSSEPGLQHGVRVLVHRSSLSSVDGWRVELTVTQPSGTQRLYGRDLWGEADVLPLAVNFESVDFGTREGASTYETGVSVSFSAVVIDRAGNVSAPVTATFNIDRVPPTLTQQNPAPSQVVLTAADDFKLSTPEVDVDFRYLPQGAAGACADPATTTSDCLTLTVAPPPLGMNAGAFPLAVAHNNDSTVFAPLPFADGSYVASAVVYDAAGNRSAPAPYNFDVLTSIPKLTFSNSFLSTTLINSGWSGFVTVNTEGFAAATPVQLCSTVAPPSGPATACRWGEAGDGTPTLGAAGAGFVVATATVTGSTTSGFATFSGVVLGEGVQRLHAEAQGSSAAQDASTPFHAVLVDTVPPQVGNIVLNNDTQAPVLVLNASERDVISGKLRTQVTVSATNAGQGQLVQVYAEPPTGGTLVGYGTLGPSDTATFDVRLSSGQQTLFARVFDAAGNFGDSPAASRVSVRVDFTAGTVTLPPPAFNPYTLVHGSTGDVGSVNDQGTGSRADDTLDVDLSVTVSDNQTLAGATVTLERYAGAVCTGSPAASQQEVLAAGQTNVVFAAFALGMNQNCLRARFTDAAGNVTNSVDRVYGADFYGPELVLVPVVQGVAGVSGDCPQGTPCPTDILDPAANNNRAVFDAALGDVYRAAGVNDLALTLTGCANAPAYEDCSATPITVRLRSLVVGAQTTMSTVANSTFAAAGDLGPTALYSLLVNPDPAFNPGSVREVRVSAVDKNGNTGRSNSLYLYFDVSGVLIDVERLDAAMAPTGDLLQDDTYWGQAHNLNGTGLPFLTNLRVTVTPIGGESVQDVTLTVNAGAPQYTSTLGYLGGPVDFVNVQLAESPDPQNTDPNAVDITVTCAAPPNPCGQLQLTGVIADVTSPSYEFDRCSLCALQVPLVGAGWCAAHNCAVDADGDADANVSGAPAIWSAALDPNANPDDGFTTTAGTPLVVKVYGLEDGEPVTLVSNRGGLSGATALSGSGSAVFSSLGVPSLAGTDQHVISVAFTDRAGNAAVDPQVPRVNEVLVARTDTLAPASVAPVVCIGESTPPASADTNEDAACATACGVTDLCDRRRGEVSLLWTAPADDAGVGAAVTSYELSYAALGVSYGRANTLCTNSGQCTAGSQALGGCALSGPESNWCVCQTNAECAGGTRCINGRCKDWDHYDTCAAFDGSGAVEGVVTYGGALAAPGQTEFHGFGGLLPHRAYCFAVAAIDDVGNRASVAGFATRRDLPWVNLPAAIKYEPTAVGWEDDEPGAAWHLASPAGGFYGPVVVNAGDLDGDGGDDFAVGGLSSDEHITLYLSSEADVSPLAPLVIEAPAIGGSFGTQFGFPMAAGDVNGDGRNDLVVAAPAMAVASGPRPGDLAGALFIYYGVPGVGIRQIANSGDSELPSLRPDVAILAGEFDFFGIGLAVGDINGQGAADIVAIGPSFSVFGFFGGATRFSVTPGGTTKIHMSFATTSSAQNTPELAIAANAQSQTFPWAVAVADVDGDGVGDLAASDHTLTPSGAVFVFKGGAGLSGSKVLPTAPARPAPAAGDLLHVLRYVSTSSNFGQTLLAVPAPRAGDGADWLLVLATGSTSDANPTDQVIVFKGSDTGAPAGIQPPDYPTNGLSLASYSRLPRALWNGARPNFFGYNLALAGDVDLDGGVDVCAGAGRFFTGPLQTFFFSYDAATDGFVRRVILHGQGTASACGAVTGYVGALGVPFAQPVLATHASGGVFVYK